MKDQALAIARGASDSGKGLNLLREYMQVFVLRALHDCEAFRALALTGGAALRLLHGLPRFCEDLHFALERPAQYDGRAWAKSVKRELMLAGFEAEVAWNDRNPLHMARVRLPGILREAGCDPVSGQDLSIKLEIDIHSPTGARAEGRVITRRLNFFVRHHDMPSLLAGKLHAIIAHPFVKGRDWFDLLWFLSHHPGLAPNLDFLQQALDLAQGIGQFKAEAWHSHVRDRLKHLDLEAVRGDLLPFLEGAKDAKMPDRENLENLLKKASHSPAFGRNPMER